MIGRVFICQIDYVEEGMEAERRLRAGEHEHNCAKDGRWYWPEHKEEHQRVMPGCDPQPSMYEPPSPRIRAKKRAACADCRTVAEAHANRTVAITAAERRAAFRVIREPAE